MGQGLVLSLCDLTGNICKPWADAGYECLCIDLQHPGRSQVGNITFLNADVTDYLPPNVEYKIVFAFPPCTDLAVSGAKHFKSKGFGKLIDSLQVVRACQRIAEWTGKPYLIENPVSTLSSYWRKPDHIFNPFDYGDAYAKKTCLWTGGGFLMPSKTPVEPVKVCEQGSWIQKLGGSSIKTKNLRAATPMGFARAVYEANKESK